jgi:hypothetical protein
MAVMGSSFVQVNELVYNYSMNGEPISMAFWTVARVFSFTREITPL